MHAYRTHDRESKTVFYMPSLVWFLFQGIAEYKRFMEDTNKLAKCQVLVVSLGNYHAHRSTMIHLLRKCSGLRKLVVQVSSLSVCAFRSSFFFFNKFYAVHLEM